MTSWRSPEVWRWVGLALTLGSCALWVAATMFGFIGDTRFIGHASMFALVLAGLSTWRSDET